MINTFRTAFRDARKNLLHTLLSVLGIVIGVGALVAILSLIDGLEKYAHEQISSTSSLLSMTVSTQKRERKDGLLVEKKAFSYFDYTVFDSLRSQLEESQVYIFYQESGYITVQDTIDRGVLLTGIVETENEKIELLEGRYLHRDDLSNGHPVALISTKLASALEVNRSWPDWIGKKVPFKMIEYEVVGVVKTPMENLRLFIPVTLIPQEDLRKSPPRIVIEASSTEIIPQLKEEVQVFLDSYFPDSEGDFKVVTNEYRVQQANQGFLVFRIVMGLVVGISVLVGGIGVMNVLLISVNERTAEIGVRKAVGAKKKDIVLQFLSESLSISLIGSFLGVLLGISFSLLVIPIIKHLTEIPFFEAAYTFETLMIIVFVAILVGVIFGTYPALKAARLDPVEAIRRE
ncbi:MAG: ABC transporter permease [Bacteroidota bacterium]